MNTELIHIALEQKNITPTAKLLLVTLADLADVDGYVTATTADLGKRVGIARQTVNLAIQLLERRHLVAKHVELFKVGRYQLLIGREVAA